MEGFGSGEPSQECLSRKWYVLSTTPAAPLPPVPQDPKLEHQPKKENPGPQPPPSGFRCRMGPGAAARTGRD